MYHDMIRVCTSPVVRNSHDRARKLVQEILQPGHRLGVQVVGGLVGGVAIMEYERQADQ